MVLSPDVVRFFVRAKAGERNTVQGRWESRGRIVVGRKRLDVTKITEGRVIPVVTRSLQQRAGIPMVASSVVDWSRALRRRIPLVTSVREACVLGRALRVGRPWCL